MVDEEEWRDVVGYEGYYSVSSHGRCRSEDRERVYANGVKRMYPSRMLKQVLAAGHYQVTLKKENEKQETVAVHRLVAEAFIGKCPRGKIVVHKDGNPLNNHLSNLEYGTMKETQQRFAAKGRHCKGDAHPRAKLTSAAIQIIRDRYRAGESQGAIAKDLGVTRSTIGSILRGRTWKGK